jgi:hypothetical protein
VAELEGVQTTQPPKVESPVGVADDQTQVT